MLVPIALFLALVAGLATLACFIGPLARARFFVGLPLALGIVGAGFLALALAGEPALAEACAAGVLLLTLLVRLVMRRWSWLAALLFGSSIAGTLTYLAYAALLSYAAGLGWIGIAGSTVLLVLEILALGLAATYLFEILDVLGRRPQPQHQRDAGHLPAVALQVPAYNEPVEVVGETLRSLASLEYPRLLVQVVDNNTEDPAVWKPLEELCRELGDRFQFIHLENWPGYKAGALNEANKRLPQDIEVVGIVDADYLVEPNWLKETVGHFADPEVAFVQTPQDYRDWDDNGYLRGLYHSYRYFFDVTMPAREHRNAIIFAGTMGLIRLSALQEIGGWNPDCITEDAEASLRMLALGYRGVFEHRSFGRGLMPLDFDGLKKQRFRWALGGVQILKRHWRELVPLIGRGRLTTAQRIHYLLGSVQWYGEALMAVFTAVLVATALATAMHHSLPIRRLTGAAMAIPIAFLLTGVLRAVWAIRATGRCSWRDAFHALRIWFALSWVVTLACVRGLVEGQTAFLRTPKKREGTPALLNALRSSYVEALITIAALAAGLAMLVRAFSWGTVAVFVLVAFQAFLYSNAVWAGAAAEGITLTPLRRAYLRSAQNTGERTQRAARLATIPAFAVLVALVAAFTLVGVTAPPQAEAPNPVIAPLTGGSPAPAEPAASPSPAAPLIESPSPALSPVAASPSPVSVSPSP